MLTEERNKTKKKIEQIKINNRIVRRILNNNFSTFLKLILLNHITKTLLGYDEIN